MEKVLGGVRRLSVEKGDPQHDEHMFIIIHQGIYFTNKFEYELNKHVYFDFSAICNIKREIIVMEPSCCYITFNPSHLHFAMPCITQLKETSKKIVGRACLANRALSSFMTFHLVYIRSDTSGTGVKTNCRSWRSSLNKYNNICFTKGQWSIEQ